MIEFKHDFSVWKENGVLHFGDIAIDTAGNDDGYYTKD